MPSLLSYNNRHPNALLIKLEFDTRVGELANLFGNMEDATPPLIDGKSLNDLLIFFKVSLYRRGGEERREKDEDDEEERRRERGGERRMRRGNKGNNKVTTFEPSCYLFTHLKVSFTRSITDDSRITFKKVTK